MNNRSLKREVAWEEMKKLEHAGLGYCEVVSASRDKLLLDSKHPSADRLSRRPNANGFIRSDEDTLLFRDASSELQELMAMPHLLSALNADKGVEFRWSAIDVSDIRRLFEIVARLAGGETRTI